MAENLGGIYWTADIDTQGLVEGERQIKRSVQGSRSEVQKLETSMKRSSSAVNRGFSNMGGSVGRVGIQIQQLTGQIQGGQSAMLALSQQAADVGIVMGAPLIGVIVSLAAAVGGTLVNALNKAEDGLNDLPTDLTERIEKIKDKLSETDDVSIGSSVRVETAKLNSEYDKQLERIAKLNQFIADLRDRIERASDPRTVKLLTQEIGQAERSLSDARDRASSLSKAISQVVRSGIDAKDGFDGVSESAEETEGKIDRSAEATEKLKQRLEVAKLAAEGNTAAAARLAAAYQLGLTNAEQLPESIRNLLAELERVQTQQSVNAELDKMFEKEKLDAIKDREKAEIEAQRAIQKAEDERRAKAQARSDRIASIEQEIRLQEIRNQLGNDEYEIRAAIMALGEGATDVEKERIAGLIEQMQALRLEADLVGQSIKESFQEIGVSALDDFSQGLASAIVQGESVEDMLKGLARSIISDLLAAVIRYWVGQAAAALIGTGAMMATTGTAAAASAAAWAPAATLASIATLGGAAGIGTAAVGAALAAGTAMGTMAGAVGAGAGAATGMAGGRLYGGPVEPGNMYPVTEDGRPEMLVQNGRQYLLPGARGEVISNRDMRSSDNSNVSVTMPIQVYGNADGQQIRNALFDQEDLIFELVENAKAKRGIRGFDR